jgi:hypothetical protein
LRRDDNGDGPVEHHGVPPLDPILREDVVRFLRQWLPPDAVRAYRDAIRQDPYGWFRSPHFASGYVVQHLFRGNGITESALGVPSLEPYWPDLLREAVQPL